MKVTEIRDPFINNTRMIVNLKSQSLEATEMKLQRDGQKTGYSQYWEEKYMIAADAQEPRDLVSIESFVNDNIEFLNNCTTLPDTNEWIAPPDKLFDLRGFTNLSNENRKLVYLFKLLHNIMEGGAHFSNSYINSHLSTLLGSSQKDNIQKQLEELFFLCEFEEYKDLAIKSLKSGTHVACFNGFVESVNLAYTQTISDSISELKSNILKLQIQKTMNLYPALEYFSSMHVHYLNYIFDSLSRDLKLPNTDSRSYSDIDFVKDKTKRFYPIIKKQMQEIPDTLLDNLTQGFKVLDSMDEKSAADYQNLYKTFKRKSDYFQEAEVWWSSKPDNKADTLPNSSKLQLFYKLNMAALGLIDNLLYKFDHDDKEYFYVRNHKIEENGNIKEDENCSLVISTVEDPTTCADTYIIKNASEFLAEQGVIEGNIDLQDVFSSRLQDADFMSENYGDLVVSTDTQFLGCTSAELKNIFVNQDVKEELDLRCTSILSLRLPNDHRDQKHAEFDLLKYVLEKAIEYQVDISSLNFSFTEFETAKQNEINKLFKKYGHSYRPLVNGEQLPATSDMQEFCNQEKIKQTIDSIETDALKAYLFYSFNQDVRAECESVKKHVYDKCYDFCKYVDPNIAADCAEIAGHLAPAFLDYENTN